MQTDTPLSSNTIKRRGRPVKYSPDLSAYHCPFCGAMDGLKVRAAYGKTERRYLLKCLGCGKTFSDRKGTALSNSKKPAKDVARIVHALCDGSGIRGASRICGVNRKTVARCLRKVGRHAASVSSGLSRNLNLREVQADEAYTTVWKRKENIVPEDLITHPDAGKAWIFAAIDAETKFVPHLDVARDLKVEATERFFKGLCVRLGNPWPLFATDMRPVYRNVLIKALAEDGVNYVQAEHFKEMPTALHQRKLRCEGKPIYKPSRQRIVMGDSDEIREHYKQSTASKKINTSFIERLFKTFRTGNRRLQRKANGISKKRQPLQDQLALYVAYYNFVKEHRSLRLENGHDGSDRKWDARTPAMAAKLTDHRWTVAELLQHIV